LTFGEVVSLFGCFAMVVSVILSLSFAMGKGTLSWAVWVLIGSAFAFLYSAAIALLFRLVKRLFAE